MAAAAQSLLAAAVDENGLVNFGGRDRSVYSIIILNNGIAFAIQAVIFLVLGSFADFGKWRPNVLIVATTIYIVIGFAFLGIHTMDQWVADSGSQSWASSSSTSCLASTSPPFPAWRVIPLKSVPRSKSASPTNLLQGL